MITSVRGNTFQNIRMAKTGMQQEKPRVYTVSSLTRLVREMMEEQVGPVWVEGEVSRPVRPASGHLYLTLKDKDCQLKAVVFKNRLNYLAFVPEEGTSVLAFGRLTVYEPRGEYQLIVEHLEPLGAGALALAFEQLKEKLAQEGLFDQERKKTLPILPRRVAVVTSPTGAALYDFLRILRRRHPGLNILVAPVRVQGQEAPGMIARALADLNQMDRPPEVVVVTRGGGSLEDLWAFNTEEVARAVAASKIPVVSAVGHEVDFTICDFTADVRASTPSAAAEILIRPRDEWLDRINSQTDRLLAAMESRLNQEAAALSHLSGRLSDPRRMMERRTLRIADLTDRLALAGERFLRDMENRRDGLAARLAARSPQNGLVLARERLTALESNLRWRMESLLGARAEKAGQMFEMLGSLSPLKILARGYSLTRLPDGRVLRSAGEVGPGDRVEVILARGELGCLVSESRPGPGPETPQKKNQGRRSG